MENPPFFSENVQDPTEQFLGEPVEDLEQNLVVYRPLRAVPDLDPAANPGDQTTGLQPDQTSAARDAIALGLEAFVAVCREEDPELFDHLTDGLSQIDRREHLARVLSLLKRRRNTVARSYDEVPETWPPATPQPEDPAVVHPTELSEPRPAPKIALRVVRTAPLRRHDALFPSRAGSLDD